MNDFYIPSTVSYYTIKRKPQNSNFQVKLSQTSKTMLNFVRKVRGYQFDELTIFSTEQPLVYGFLNDILAEVNVRNIVRWDKPISVGSYLTFARLTGTEV